MPPRKRARSEASSASKPRVVIISEDPPNALNAKLSLMRTAGKLVDVTVRASGSVEFSAHRNVLAASSDYLDALFSSGMSDAESDVVVLRSQPLCLLLSWNSSTTASAR